MFQSSSPRGCQVTTITRRIAREVRIAIGARSLEGTLTLPEGASGVVLFAHGSGSSRHSPRNRLVADAIVDAGIGTLLFDLLTAEEGALDAITGHLRFDIGLLATRLEQATAIESLVASAGAKRSSCWHNSGAARFTWSSLL